MYRGLREKHNAEITLPYQKLLKPYPQTVQTAQQPCVCKKHKAAKLVGLAMPEQCVKHRGMSHMVIRKWQPFRWP